MICCMIFAVPLAPSAMDLEAERDRLVSGRQRKKEQDGERAQQGSSEGEDIQSTSD